MTNFYTPHTKRGERGFIAGVYEVHSDTFYECTPLGEAKYKEFYSEAAARDLSEAHANNANRRGGLEALPNLRKVS